MQEARPHQVSEEEEPNLERLTWTNNIKEQHFAIQNQSFIVITLYTLSSYAILMSYSNIKFVLATFAF